MSEFFRMPREWHESLDNSLSPLYTIDYMTGSKMSRIIKRLERVLENKPTIKKWDFCKSEGITMALFNSTLNNKSFNIMIWEEGNEIGKS